MIGPRFLSCILVISVGMKYAISQGNDSNHSQNIQTNNGITVQVNVEKNLKRIAKSQLDERGWMRLLTPAHDPAPSICSSSGEGKTKPLVISYGSNGAYCKRESCTIVAGRRGADEVPLITVRKVKNGLMLDAKIFDPEGNIIASIVGDKPHINRNFASDWSRPDEHSLSVTDNHDKRVLYVRFLNETSLYLEGSFYLPFDLLGPNSPHRGLELAKNAMTVLPNGGKLLEDVCMGESIGSMIVFSDTQ